jgi:hypothetical protein
MSNTNTGGPAFPFPAYTYPNGEINHGEGGMTLRDYFAAKAMQGMMACPGSIRVNDDANFAYQMADAMLKAREA